VKRLAGQNLESAQINFVPAVKLDVFLGKISPTTPISFTGLKKLAATAAWLAEPPSRRGFRILGF